MGWMVWTLPTAVFFVVILGGLVGMTVWELCSPCTPRRGLLPFTTTRGDRFFLGLLAAGFLALGWIGVTDASSWVAGVLALGGMGAVGRWA